VCSDCERRPLCKLNHCRRQLRPGLRSSMLPRLNPAPCRRRGRRNQVAARAGAAGRSGATPSFFCKLVDDVVY
jgi:hypothetical protein